MKSTIRDFGLCQCLAGLVLVCLFPSLASAAELRLPATVDAGQAFSVPLQGSGEATFYLVGPDHVVKRTVKLGGEARFRIDKFVIGAGGTLDLERGPLVIDREDPSRKENLQIRSPFGLIAVRGTLLFAGPSDNVFGVFVGRGAVSVSSGGRTVNLHPGQGTNIARPGDPPSDVVRWGEGRIKAALASVG